MLSAQFMEHVALHGNSFGTVKEFNLRMDVFAELDKKINAHNATESSFKLGHNYLSTYTEAELKSSRGYLPVVGDAEHSESNSFVFDL